MTVLQSYYATAATAVTAAVAALLSYVVYQLFLHPLAEYPGPVSGRLTGLWSLYHALRADRHLALYRLHERYGAIVRYGPNHISVNDAGAVEKIYGAKANVQKSSYYTSGFGISLFNCTDRQVHARKRRVTVQAFSEQAIRNMEPYVLSTVRDWCAAIGRSSESDSTAASTERQSSKGSSAWSPPRDIAQWSCCMTFDTLGEIAFGKSFGTSARPDQRLYLDVMALNSRIIDITGQMPWLGRWGLDHYLRSGTVADRKLQTGLPRQQLAARIAEDPSKTDRRDVLYFLMQARDPDTGKGYSSAELMAECNLLLGAGTDTTATALTAAFYFLVHHADVLAELTDTIRNSFGNVESIVKGPTLNGLWLLHACIDEAMRLCPPVAGLLSREVLPGGQEILGRTFPAGTVVGIPTYSLHHNAAYFDEPYRFRPRRWLEAEIGTEMLARQRQAFIPFSVGPRACIAKKVALLELELCLTRALFVYDIRCASGSEHVGVGPQGEYLIRENFIVGRQGPVVQFKALGGGALNSRQLFSKT